MTNIETYIEKIDKLEESNIVIKESVIGFLVVKHERDDESFFIETMPISHGWDGSNFDYYLNPEKDKIIGIVPSPPNTFEISGIFPYEKNGKIDSEYPDTGIYEILGYEFAGAYVPNWKEELKHRLVIKLQN